MATSTTIDESTLKAVVTTAVTTSDHRHRLHQSQSPHPSGALPFASTAVADAVSNPRRRQDDGHLLSSPASKHSTPAIRFNDSNRSVFGIGRPASLSGTLRGLYNRRNGSGGGTFSPPSFASGANWPPIAIGAVSGAEAFMRRTSPYRLSDIVHGGPSRVHSLTTVAVITAIFVAITLGTTILVAAVCCRYTKTGCRRRRRYKRAPGDDDGATTRRCRGDNYDCEMNEFNDVSDDATSEIDNVCDYAASRSSFGSASTDCNAKCARSHVTRSRSESSAMAMMAANSRTNLLLVADDDDGDGAMSFRRSTDLTSFQIDLNGGSIGTLAACGEADGRLERTRRCSTDDTDCSDEDDGVRRDDGNKSEQGCHNGGLSSMFRTRQGLRPDGYHRLTSPQTDHTQPNCYTICHSLDDVTALNASKT
jgi:hypothetical protein